MTKDKIIFFASGDFAIDTFESLLINNYNIVGLVTSNDTVKFHSVRICDVARKYGVPVYVIKNEVNMQEDEFFVDWLRRANADLFCVISFKKLPSEIIKFARKCAFNVHASLLPFLRGAAPINWAIRLGYKETGLTAFVLSDKIDQGDIIANTRVKIASDEKYTTLYKKLSNECVDFTKHVIDDFLQKEDWRDFLLAQPSWNEREEIIRNAPKLNNDYFYGFNWFSLTAQKMKNIVDSVDDIGLPCSIVTKTDSGKELIFDAKIYEVEIVKEENNTNKLCESDGKTFIKINFPLGEGESLLVKKIQLAGKKIMTVKDFLNGFRYFRDNIETTITYPKYLQKQYE